MQHCRVNVPSEAWTFDSASSGDLLPSASYLRCCVLFCLSVYLSMCFCLSICLSVCLSVYSSIYLSICPFVTLSVCQCLSVRPSDAREKESGAGLLGSENLLIGCVFPEGPLIAEAKAPVLEAAVTRAGRR